MDLILTLVAALTGGGTLGFIQFMINRKDNGDDFKEKVTEKLHKIEELGVQMNDKFDKQSALNVAEGKILLDGFNRKFREMGYIPDDEYPMYKMLGERYIGAGGNSDVKAMFERNMTYLKVHK